MKIYKKFLGVFIIFCLALICLMSVSVFAASEHTHCVCGGNTAIGDHTTHTNTTFTEWTSTDSMPTTAGNYVLMNDVTISNSWKPTDNTVLCLNGHKLIRSADNSGNYAINVNGNFTLCDCQQNSGCVTGAELVGVYVDSGTFRMYGGNITDNGIGKTTQYSVGNYNGVVIYSGEFILYNGIISDNGITVSSYACGVVNYSQFTMYGGQIDGNTGHGVYNRKGTFTMSGGTISNNDVSNQPTADSANYGGGVLNQSIFVMSGGSITGNISADSAGGGVWSTSDGTITISNNVKITGNTANGEVSNLHLEGDGTTDAKITIGSDGIDTAASIGVTVDDNHSKVICDNGATYLSAFFSDNDEYEVVVDGTSLKLAKHTHSYTNGFCDGCGGYQPATLNSGVYEISNAGQLFWFASLVNGDTTQEGITAAVPSANAVLTGNIDLGVTTLTHTSTDWTPIGTEGVPYTGTFDGKDYTVSELYINNSSSDRQGLFGYVNGGTVQNVSVSGNVTGKSHVGGLAGYIKFSTITNCSSSVEISGYYYVSGVVGYNNEGTITNCSNSGSVTGDSYVGGVVGRNHYGAVVNCSNSGKVSGTSYLGGLVGYNIGYNNSSTGTVTNCSNSGKVSGVSQVGGIVGYNYGTLKDSYNTGTVNATYNTPGGVVGYNQAREPIIGTVTNCYYLNTTVSAAYGTNNGGTIGDDVLSKTANEFTSGEVTYLLTGGTTDGTQAWYQDIDNGNTVDIYPVLDSTHGTVYYTTTGCDGSSVTDGAYSNNIGTVIHVGSSYDGNGFCANCSAYEPATLNSSGVYEISNTGQLFWFASIVKGDTNQEGITAAVPSANAVLTNDIDLSVTTSTHTSTEWTSIGTKDVPYTGTFNGGSYTVSGLSITAEAEYIGLFGYVTGGTIKNLTVSGAINVSGTTIFAGGIVGTIRNGTLSNLTSNVSVTGTTTTKGTFGGVAATVEGTDGTAGSTMELCINNGNVTASGVLDCTGGLVGYMNSATITNCINNGEVDTTGATAQQNAGINTGGIVGYINNKTAYITNCVNIGGVSNTSSTSTMTCYTGAVVGRIRTDIGGITNVYYLDTSAAAGCGENENGAELGITSQTAEKFTDGEAAWSLQNANTDYVWGQELSTDPYPVLTDDTDIKVVKVSFYIVTNGAAEADPLTYGYTNYGLAYSDYPTDTSYTFYSDVNLSSEITDTTAYTFTSDGIVYIKQAYSVTNSLTNITSSNTATTINYGESYSATLTAASGYDLPDSITVTVGGTELTAGTDYTYDSSTGALSISSVTGDIVITAAAEQHIHSYDEGVVTKAATCTENGVKTYTCSGCGDSYTEVIPATGHSYDEGVVTTEANCTTDGVMTYTCTACGDTYTEVIPAVGHSYDEGAITTEVTCTTDGVITYTCTVCDHTYTEVIPATGHTEEIDSRVEPTCTSTGLTEGSHCSVCNEVIIVQEVIPATGHTTEIQNAKDATCTTDGYTGDEVCTVCGETVTTGQVIPATGHTTE
ncbi:MAG: hypothetical protein LUC97_09380, partial [Clostridiales bacterium]|nr:hypothetical protein [Clostridiales bacterium]